MDKEQLELDNATWKKRKQSEREIQNRGYFGYKIYDIARAHKWFNYLERNWYFDYGSQPSDFYENVEFLFEKNYAQPGQKFLDMGSGNGFMVLNAAKSGFQAYGIEYNPIRAISSQLIIKEIYKKAMLPEDSICKIVRGTYFTPEYIEFRNSGNSIAPEPEKGHSRYQYKERYQKLVGSKKAYAKLEITPADIDVFFLYNEGFSLYSIAEFISMNAKPGAIFFTRLGTWDEKDSAIVNSLGFEVVGNHYSTYVPDDDSTPNCSHQVFLRKLK